jgi:hypothetical protein
LHSLRNLRGGDSLYKIWKQQQTIRYNNYNIHSTIDDNMEIDDIFAKEHIQRWVKAWNDHNIKEILSLYSENILFSSPKIKLVYPN